MLESLEVKLEALAVGAAREPAAELARVAGRQLAVADLGRELDNSFWSQAPSRWSCRSAFGASRIVSSLSNAFSERSYFADGRPGACQ